MSRVLLISCLILAVSMGACSSAGDTGVPGSRTLAELQKQADAGDASAQASLGWRYSVGEDVPQNYSKAVEWYTRAADQRNVRAQLDLGLIYLDGKGVPKDLEKGRALVQDAAMRGYHSAQEVLGMMYMHGGKGVPLDFVLAYAWLNLAATKGPNDAKELRARISLSPSELAEAQQLSAEWKPGQGIERENR